MPEPSTVPTTGRIARRFSELREAGELGLIAYITAGDPSLDATLEIALAAAQAGADILELGVPFSDPLADGPVIQRASERALLHGATLAGVLAVAGGIREKSDIPIVLFSYFNPILQMGLQQFADAASRAGADGVLVTDLTPEESSEYRNILRARHLDTVFLAAPTSTEDRLRLIASVSSGFLYLIARTGVTGERTTLSEGLPAMIRRVRQFTTLPIAAGFGISLPPHVSVLGGIADAAVVGSALVAEIERSGSPQAAAQAVATRIAELKAAARRGVSRRSAPIAPGA